MHETLHGCKPGSILAGTGLIRTVRCDMPLRNLGQEFEGSTVVHISDLHAGPLVSQKHLFNLADRVSDLGPDFVAITGDFVTLATPGSIKFAARVAGRIRARRAVIACLGNHDYGIWHPMIPRPASRSAGQLARQLADRGVRVLRNESRTFFRGEAAIQFVGVDDYWSANYCPSSAFDLIDRDTPTIALVHNPDAAIEMASWSPDWILAGHTHGQATPDTRFWNMVYPTRHKRFVAGQYEVTPMTRLHVSRGIGGSVCRPGSRKTELTILRMRQDGVHSNTGICLTNPLLQGVR